MQDKTELIESAAARLWSAETQRSPCRPVRELIGNTDINLAYAIQQHNINRQVETGRRISGRKIGLTSKTVQQQMKVFEPDFGTLFADMETGHGGIIPSGRLIAPKVEAEIMLVLKDDLNHETITFSDVIRATEFVIASLEIVDCRLRDWDICITDTIADNAAAAMYVVGSQAKLLTEIDLSTCSMSLLCNGQRVSEGHGELCMGHPINAAVWLARQLYKQGTPLKSGEVILTGALGPMVPAMPGDHFEARIEGLGKVIAEFE